MFMYNAIGTIVKIIIKLNTVLLMARLFTINYDYLFSVEMILQQPKAIL